MNIDWASLGLVAIVTIAATVLIVSIVSGGALMLDRAHARTEAGKDGAAGLIVLCRSDAGALRTPAFVVLMVQDH